MNKTIWGLWKCGTPEGIQRHYLFAQFVLNRHLCYTAGEKTCLSFQFYSNDLLDLIEMKGYRQLTASCGLQPSISIANNTDKSFLWKLWNKHLTHKVTTVL